MQQMNPSELDEAVVYIRLIDNKTFKSFWCELTNISTKSALTNYRSGFVSNHLLWHGNVVTIYIN